MDNQMHLRSWVDEEREWGRWTRRRLAIIFVSLLISGSLMILSFTGAIIPSNHLASDWFQRSGAAVAIFCMYNQQTFTAISSNLLPAGGVFGSAGLTMVWSKYRRIISRLDRVNFGLMLFATAVWGYGDVMHSSLTTFLGPY
ncbi:hypothetical protein ACLO6V_17660 [Alcaligenes ammonioxydans]